MFGDGRISREGGERVTTSSAPTVVLVHGAFSDASCFRGVIRELQAAGHSVVAPPNPLRSLAFDAAAIAAYVRAIDGPVVLVGHSYGGAVITQASADLDNVAGLVYLAAFGLDVGESCAGVQQPFPPSLLSSTSYPTAFDAPGAPQGPDLYINRERFRETFCADAPVDTAEAMFATQRPLSLAALTENATAAKSLAGSHTVFIARPVTVADFIVEALHDVELIRPPEETAR